MVDIGHKSDLLRMDHDRLMEFEEFDRSVMPSTSDTVAFMRSAPSPT